MSAGEQALRIDVGHGAGGGNIHIAANQHGADGGSGLDWFRLLAIARRANAHHGNDARRRELRPVALQGLVGKTVEHERSFDGLQIVAVALGRERSAFAGAGGWLWFAAWLGEAGAGKTGTHRRRTIAGLLCRTMIQRIDLQHLLDRRHARDRFLGELADAEGQRARQLAVEINRASAHARNHAGIFGLGAVQTDQDNVALGTVHVAHHAQNFHVHGFGFHALEHGERCASHAFVDLVERHDGGRNGGGRR